MSLPPEPINAADPAATALHARLRAAGLRRTRALGAVLALFAQAPTWSPTHHQVAERLSEAGEAVNPVTLYRLLDRLVSAGVLARHTAADERAWRFQWCGAQPEGEGGDAHPHFECDHCHSHFLLTDADAPTQAVADALRRTLAAHGHQAARVDLAVHGLCADCRVPDAP
ncbi:MAG: transcriptional repressor [Pseudomonadota bacterium]|nr:transcriptional repressor [Pseudomonadota bacterium]